MGLLCAQYANVFTCQSRRNPVGAVRTNHMRTHTHRVCLVNLGSADPDSVRSDSVRSDSAGADQWIPPQSRLRRLMITTPPAAANRATTPISTTLEPVLVNGVSPSPVSPGLTPGLFGVAP